MKKKWLIIFLILIVLGTGIYFYINNYFFPIQLKQIIRQKAQEYLARNVSFKEIRYHPLKGIVIEAPVIYQKDNPQEPFFTAAEIYGNILFAPLLKNKKIVIPSFTIDTPALYITRISADEWNFSDLIKPKTAQDQKSSFSFILGGLTVQDGFVSYKNSSLAQPQTSLLKDLQAHIKLSLKEGIGFELTTRLIEEPATSKNADGFVNGKGNFKPFSKELKAALSAQNIPLAKYLNEFYPNIPFALKEGFIDQARLQISCHNDGLHLAGGIKAKTDLVFSGQGVKGDFDFTEFVFDKDTSGLNLAGLLNMDRARISFNEQGFFEGSGSVKIKNLSVIDKQVSFEGDIETSPSVLQWQENRTLQAALKLSGLTLKRDGNELSLTARMDIKNTQADFDDTFTLTGDISASALSASFKNGIVSINTSFRIDAADIRIQGDKHVTGTLIADDISASMAAGQTDGSGELHMDDARLAFNGIKYSGSPHVIYEFVYDPQKTNPLTYKGIFKAAQGVLENVPRLGLVDKIQGTINFRTEYFQTDALTLLYDGIPLQISGSMTGIETPELDIKANVANADLEKLYSYLPAQFKESGVRPTGSTDIKLAYKGPLNPPDTSGLDITAAIRDGTLAGLKVPENMPDKITGITGIVKYKNDVVYWKNLKCLFLDDTYEINGQMENLPNPLIETEVTSSLTNFFARLSMSQDTFNISVLKGAYKNMAFDFTGQVQRQDQGPVYYDIDGSLGLDAADLKDILPGHKEQLASLNPAGRLEIAGRFKGRAEALENAFFNAGLKSPDLSLSGYHFRNFSAELKHKPGEKGALNSYASFYDGDFALLSLFDLNKRTWPLEISAQLKNTDLAKLRKDSKWKGQDLAGTLNINMSARGSFKDLNTLAGDGKLSIAKGHIWKLQILEGVWKLLFIPEFAGVVFTDAYVPFTIKDRRVATDNLILKGQTADMAGQGWIDFDKNLNFVVSPVFRQTDVYKSESVKKSLSSLLADTEGYIEITISGTLDKPRYSINTLPTKMLKKATDAFIEGVGDLFKDLF